MLLLLHNELLLLRLLLIVQLLLLLLLLKLAWSKPPNHHWNMPPCWHEASGIPRLSWHGTHARTHARTHEPIVRPHTPLSVAA